MALKTVAMALFCISMISCGDPISKKAPSSSGATVSAEWLAGVISVPPRLKLGGVTKIAIQGKDYSIGNQTDATILGVIHGLPEGSITNVSIQGTFERETGHLPNPTVEVDVVQIRAIQLSGT